MITLGSLWLPILLSAVLVYLASTIIHMALRYHSTDLKKLPDEKAVTDALRPFNLSPGEYHFPHADNMGDMKSPEFQERFKKGPVGFLTIFPNQMPSMPKFLIQWFVYNLFIAFISAYVASRAVHTGGEYLAVFRFAGVTTFCCYAVALWQSSIWFGRSWTTNLKSTFDALIYAMLTGGVFGWLWPR